MGYTTKFTGTLEFIEEPKASVIAYLKNQVLGEDCREHPKWPEILNMPEIKDFTYLDFELTEYFEGIEWDGSEKSYDMPAKVGVICALVRNNFPEFKGFKGRLEAQGDEVDDRWYLKMNEDGMTAKRVDIKPTGEKICCPLCQNYFRMKDKYIVAE